MKRLNDGGKGKQMAKTPDNMRSIDRIGRPQRTAEGEPPIEADCSGSECFRELTYENGVVTASFRKDGLTHE